MPTEITVRGSFSAFQPPERGTVRVQVGFEGPEMQPVYDRTAETLATVTASIAPLHDPANGPVTWWSAEQLRTWSNRPWSADGAQLPFVHHAQVGLNVKFKDFAALSRWVGQHTVGTEGFRVSGVTWALTEKRQDKLRVDARVSAVRDAVTRAQQYADALELGTIRPIAIADAGMLDANLHPQSSAGAAYMRVGSAPGGDAPQVELVPEDIEVSALVDARFVAG